MCHRGLQFLQPELPSRKFPSPHGHHKHAGPALLLGPLEPLSAEEGRHSLLTTILQKKGIKSLPQFPQIYCLPPEQPLHNVHALTVSFTAQGGRAAITTGSDEVWWRTKPCVSSGVGQKVPVWALSENRTRKS